MGVDATNARTEKPDTRTAAPRSRSAERPGRDAPTSAGARIPDRVEREALQRALVHVVEDEVDGGHESTRLRAEVLHRSEQLGRPFLVALAREHVDHLALEHAEVPHVDL